MTAHPRSTSPTQTTTLKEYCMYRSCPPRSRHQHRATVALAGLALLGLLGLPGNVAAQGSPSAPVREEEMELPHAFFTHEGLPEGVGSYSLRLAGLATRADGKTDGDFAFHLEMGLTKLIGLHIRNDRFLDSPKSEAMFQFAAITNKSGTSGFAPIIEFQFPTHSGARGITTEVGFTTKVTGAGFAFNQVIHYGPREDAVDASAGLVVKLTKQLFPVVELLGEGGKGAPTVVNMLVGLKVRLRPGIALGFAVQVPVTKNKDYSSQMVLQPEFVWGNQ